MGPVNPIIHSMKHVNMAVTPIMDDDIEIYKMVNKS